ncbi:MAG TPA: Ig-like domain-containing protein [Candidatus Acidoferrales bacterium]|nr:Ig-like domain-containing protein [Candidatus Acidoferrales bacterium]
MSRSWTRESHTCTILLWAALVCLPGCGSSSGPTMPPPPPPASPVTIVVSPQNASVRDAGAVQAFKATGYYSDGTMQDLSASVTWASTNPAVATISAGTATTQSLPAGQSAGFTTITATVSGIRGAAILSVTSHTGNGFAGVFTQHNDNARTGQNLNETALTPVIVGNTATFGKLFTQPVDGFIYAQPLYVPNVAVAGKGTHNVVYVATENDSVFAFDADNNAGPNAAPLWQANLIAMNHGATQGETTVSSANDVGCTDLVPQVGVTSTPVIDPSTNTLYVEAHSKLLNGMFIHRLHALDITSGAKKANSPVAITATVSGTGDGSTTDVFDPLLHLNRPGLLLANGVVYLGYASHCDIQPYHGWVFAYDAGTLAQKSVFNATPNGAEGGIWQSGTGLAADDQANIYTPTGNGTFDTTGKVVDFGDSIIKLSPNSGQLALTDYFTPYDQNNLNNGDVDLGSGGVLLLPDQAGSNPHLLVQAGKEGTIYLVNRDQLTAGNLHYCSACNSDTEIVQELQGAIGGLWSTPAYWNGNLYFWGVGDFLQQYTVSSGRLSLSPAASSSINLGFPGATPAVSANGTSNAIVWAIDSTQYGFPDQANAGPAVLHAFDATNVANEFYNTTMAAGNRDTAGSAVKFAVPTIANGKVYIGTQTELDVYGP